MLAGLGLVVFSLELMIRLMRQIKRVMDPNLLKTNNLHEVKHWIEPGTRQALLHLTQKILCKSYSFQIYCFNKWSNAKNNIISELVSFGWGQFDMEEEAKLLDENKLRKDSLA